MSFQEKLEYLYSLYVSRGEKYIGGTKPENVWWCVLKDKVEYKGYTMDEIISIVYAIDRPKGQSGN